MKALKELKIRLPAERKTKGRSSTLDALKYALNCVKKVRGEAPCLCMYVYVFICIYIRWVPIGRGGVLENPWKFVNFKGLFRKWT